MAKKGAKKALKKSASKGKAKKSASKPKKAAKKVRKGAAKAARKPAKKSSVKSASTKTRKATPKAKGKANKPGMSGKAPSKAQQAPKPVAVPAPGQAKSRKFVEELPKPVRSHAKEMREADLPSGVDDEPRAMDEEIDEELGLDEDMEEELGEELPNDGMDLDEEEEEPDYLDKPEDISADSDEYQN